MQLLADNAEYNFTDNSHLDNQGVWIKCPSVPKDDFKSEDILKVSRCLETVSSCNFCFFPPCIIIDNNYLFSLGHLINVLKLYGFYS